MACKKYTAEAKIVNPGGAPGVASFVIDDLNKETAEYLSDVIIKSNPAIKVSHGAIANYVSELQTEVGADGIARFKKSEDGKYIYNIKKTELEFWKKQAELGYCDFLNHSYSHSYQGPDDKGGEATFKKPYQSDPEVTVTKKFPEGGITAEFIAAKEILAELFGKYYKDVFVIPGVGVRQSEYYNEYLKSLVGVGREFIGARGTGGGPMDSEAIMQNLNWLNAPMTVYKDDTEKWKAWLDKAVAEEKLMCYCLHRIYEDASANSLAIYRYQADDFFGYAQKLSDKGELAIMFYYDALRYFMEKSAVCVNAENISGGKIKVALSFTDEAFKNDDRMNYPLTVQVTVPENFKTVKYEKGSKICYTNTKVVGGKTVALIDVIPRESAVITPEITEENCMIKSKFAKDLGDGVMLDKNYFPGFVRKALTFTIDDGNITYDKKFLDILKPCGIKGTFNLIRTKNASAEEYRRLYDGYEVANHNLLHCIPMFDGFDKIPVKDVIYESISDIRKDKNADANFVYKSPIEGFYFVDLHYFSPTYKGPAYWHPIATDEAYKMYVDITKDDIESVFGEGSVVGYAYPHGKLSPLTKQYLIDKGYLYARKTGLLKDSTGFSLPEDRFAWTYNACQNDLISCMELYEKYPDDGELKMFSFGVHSVDYNESWDMLMEFAKIYGNRPENFYYATNREIFEYEYAVKALKYENGKLINDTVVTLYVSLNGEKIIIPANSHYEIDSKNKRDA